MIKINNVENELTQLVFNAFIESQKCNGISSSSIRNRYPNANLQEIILKLLKDDRISLIASEHDINCNIIRERFVPKKEQINYITKNGVDGYFCLYPSSKYLKQHYKENDNIPRLPFNSLLKRGFPHNKIFYFEWGVLFKYYSDPRFIFHFSDYYGEIWSSDEVNANNKIGLKTFGVGKSETGEHVVAVTLKELVNMSSACQIEWYNMLVPKQEKCKTLQNYLNNFKGCWRFEETVYSSILKELTNINKLTKTIWKCSFFKKEYEKSKLEGFDMLYLPTKKVFLDYVSLLEKIIVSNINGDFFDFVEVSRKDTSGKPKGTLQCLKEWLLKVNADCVSDIHSNLCQLREQRQEPAHRIYDNEYDLDFFSKQKELSDNVFYALYTLRRLIQSHPEVKGMAIPHECTEKYIVI